MTERDLLIEALNMWLAGRRTDYHALVDASAADLLPREAREVAKKLAAETLLIIQTAERILARIDSGDSIE